MDPQVIKVTEANQISGSGQVSKVVQITYMVGPHGPFNLYATPDELQNGEANRKLQAFAQQLRTLPMAPGV